MVKKTLIYESQTAYSAVSNDTVHKGEVYQYDFGPIVENDYWVLEDGTTQLIVGDDDPPLGTQYRTSLKHGSRAKISCPEGYLLVQYTKWTQEKQNCLNAARASVSWGSTTEEDGHTVMWNSLN